MTYQVNTGLKYKELEDQVFEIFNASSKLAKKDKPLFVEVNLLNGSIEAYPKFESVLDSYSDPQMMVLSFTRPMTIMDMFMILDRIIEMNFIKEATYIIRSRANLTRNKEEDIYVYYDLMSGEISVIPESEALVIVEGLSDEDIDRVVLNVLSSKATDNIALVEDIPQIGKQILEKLIDRVDDPKRLY